MVGLDRVRQS